MKRGEIETDFAVHMAEGMDWDTLFYFAVDMLREKYEQLSDEALLNEVQEYAPFLLDEEEV